MNSSQDTNIETQNVNSTNGGVASQPIEQPVVQTVQQSVLANNQTQVAQQPVASVSQTVQPGGADVNQNVNVQPLFDNVNQTVQPVQQPIAQPVSQPVQQPIMNNSVAQPVQPPINNAVAQQPVTPTTGNVVSQNQTSVFGADQSVVPPTFNNVTPQVQPQPINQNFNNQANDNKGNIIFIIIVVVLVGAIVTLSALYFTGKIGNKSTNESSSSTNKNSSSSSSSSNSNNSNSSDQTTIDVSGITMTIPDGYKYFKTEDGVTFIKGKYIIGFETLDYVDPASLVKTDVEDLTDLKAVVLNSGTKVVDGKTVYYGEYYFNSTYFLVGYIASADSSMLYGILCYGNTKDMSTAYSDIVKTINSAQGEIVNKSSTINRNYFSKITLIAD